MRQEEIKEWHDLVDYCDQLIGTRIKFNSDDFIKYLRFRSENEAGSPRFFIPIQYTVAVVYGYSIEEDKIIIKADVWVSYKIFTKENNNDYYSKPTLSTFMGIECIMWQGEPLFSIPFEEKERVDLQTYWADYDHYHEIRGKV